MYYRLVKNPASDLKKIWLIIIFIIFAVLIYKCTISNVFNEKFKNKLSSTKKSKLLKPINQSYNLGICSKNCCATQWPTPINTDERSKVKKSDINKKYFTSNLTCNNGVINTGCVCLTNESKQLLTNKGNVQRLPMANGLLDEDNRNHVFKLYESIQPYNLKNNLSTEINGISNDKSYSNIDYEQPIQLSTNNVDNLLFNRIGINTNISNKNIS